ncbi:MAG: GumC family protein [bacterium]
MSDYNEEMQEIDLRECVYVLWKGKKVLAGIFLISLLLSGLVNYFFLTPIYQSSTSLLLSEVTLLNEKKLNSEELLSFFYKPTVEENVMRQVKEIDDQRSFSAIKKALDISRNSDSNLVEIKYEDTDRQNAHSILSSWLSEFNREVDDFITENNQRHVQRLKKIAEDAHEAYTGALNEKVTFDQANNISLKQKEVDEKQSSLISLQQNRRDVKREIDQAQKSLEEVSRQYAKTDTFFLIKENLVNQYQLSSPIIIERKEVNPEYLTLQRKINQLNEKLHIKQHDLLFIENEISDLNKEIEILHTEIEDGKREQQLLEQRLDITNNNFTEVEKKYVSAFNSLEEFDFQIVEMEKVNTPNSPIKPNKKLNLAISLVLALFIGVFFLFVKEYFKDFDWESGQAK